MEEIFSNNIYQINEFIAEMREKFDSIMDNYFETFKEKM